LRGQLSTEADAPIVIAPTYAPAGWLGAFMLVFGCTADSVHVIFLDVPASK